MDSNNNNGEHLYSAFSTKLKALDTHLNPDRPGINLKPSQLPGKYTVRLPVIRRLRTSILTISCTVWYRVPFFCRVGWKGSDEIWTRELSHGKRMVWPLRHRVPFSIVMDGRGAELVLRGQLPQPGGKIYHFWRFVTGQAGRELICPFLPFFSV